MIINDEERYNISQPAHRMMLMMVMITIIATITIIS